MIVCGVAVAKLGKYADEQARMKRVVMRNTLNMVVDFFISPF